MFTNMSSTIIHSPLRFSKIKFCIIKTTGVHKNYSEQPIWTNNVIFEHNFKVQQYNKKIFHQIKRLMDGLEPQNHPFNTLK